MAHQRNRELLLLVLGIAPLAGACGQEAAGKQSEFEAVKKREPARVLVQTLARREMVRRLETTTRVESENQVQIFPRAPGVVTELGAEEGQKVAAGQVLAQLDDRDAQLKLSDARAALDEARANLPKLALMTKEALSRQTSYQRSFEQAERDHARNASIARGDKDTPGLISSKDLEASQLVVDRARGELETIMLSYERSAVEERNGEAAIQRAQLAVERAELELSFLRITAPIAGVIAERSIKVGDTVAQTTQSFVLTDPAHLRALFYRPQRELPLFQTSSENGNGSHASGGAELAIRAFAEALPGKVFGGRIERIAPTIDAASGNFRVTARLEGAAEGEGEARLLPGMLVRIEIVTDRHPEALVVPKRAIRREGDRNRIFVVRDGVAKSVEVEERFSDDLDVEIAPLGGAALAAGEKVVVVGNRELEDGAEVQIALEEGPAAPVVTEPPPADH
jgi:RND family efflux transporter MFP subunit